MVDYSVLRERMVANQIERRGVRDAQVLKAMREVPRHIFVPPESRSYAYADGPIRIGLGQTISQPYIVALMTELLNIEPTDKVLEVGTGSGYQAAILGELAAEVHTIERHGDLAIDAQAKLAGLGYQNVFVHSGDGTGGYPQAAPYDRILVTAASPSIPKALKKQLVDGGRLVLPIGSRNSQVLTICELKGEDFQITQHIAVVFVPLIGEDGWSVGD